MRGLKLVVPELQAMQTVLVEAPTVVDQVPALQYEHCAPEVAAKVPDKQSHTIFLTISSR